MMLRVGIIGAGSIAREYAMKYLVEEAGVSVVAIVDSHYDAACSLAEDVSYRRAGAMISGTKYRETIDPEVKAQYPKETLPVVRVYRAVETSFWDEIDFCYIATPPNYHANYAIQALHAKKHTLLEKPIAISIEDTDVIVKSAEDAWQNHQIVCNINIGMRYSQAAIEMKHLIANGYLGHVTSYSLRLLFRQWPRAWQKQDWVAERAQGGPLLEVGTHYLFGLLDIIGGAEHIQDVQGQCIFPDGIDGRLCESECKGSILLKSGVEVSLDIQTVNEEAIAAEKDIYELHAIGSNGKSLILSDFVVLKSKEGDREEVLLTGKYGRDECITELVKAAQAKRLDAATLVSPAEARHVQRLIHQLRTGHKFY